MQAAQESGESDGVSFYPAFSSSAVHKRESVSSMWLEEEEGASFALDDLDLRYSKRDREKMDEVIRSQALLQVIGEAAGEVYQAAYVDEMKKTMEYFSKKWGVDISEIVDE